MQNKRYFTGKPCLHGHTAERLTSNYGCVECKRIRQKKWERNHPKKHTAHVVAWARRHPEKKRKINERYWANNPNARRRMALARKFNLTIEQYETMSKRQKHRCAICGKEEKNKYLAVDHCHETGRVRGLLCGPCNNHLGIYERKKDLFAAYLERT